MKQAKRNGIILALITLLVLYFVLKDNFGEIITELQKANPWWIIVAILVTVIYVAFQSLGLHEIIRTYQKDFDYKKTLNLTLVTNFFNGITPFATGGQPMQVYLLKKDGIRVSSGTNIIMQNFILYQLALVIFGLIALGLNLFFHIFDNLPVLGSLIAVGFTINTIIMVGLFIISFGKKFNQWAIRLGVNVLYHLKLVKNKKKTLETWNERLDVFHEGAINLLKNKWVCIKGFIYQFMSLLCLYLLPFFIFLALGAGAEVSAMRSVVASAYVMLIGSFVPIPGASGGIEYGFLQFFGTFVKGGILSAGLLLWRFIYYYLLMIVGGIALSFRKDGKEE